jgi:AhpD family alkylhydroperoxidase
MAKTIEVTGDNTPAVIEAVLASASDGQRTGVLKDIEQTLGVVPGFLKLLPHTHLAGEWKIFKEFHLSDQTALTPKVKELIGLGIAATMRCQYCTYFHTVAAGMNGATAQEIEEALLMAKHTAGWSSLLNGSRYDIDQLKKEMTQIKAHVERSKGHATSRV